MQKKTRLIAVGALAVAVVGGASGIAMAGGSGDDDGPITGDAYDRAVAVALEETGGGTVTETEVGDEESYYQVEVTLADGTQVDVNLDKSFAVVKTKAESGDTEDDGDGDDDD